MRWFASPMKAAVNALSGGNKQHSFVHPAPNAATGKAANAPELTGTTTTTKRRPSIQRNSARVAPGASTSFRRSGGRESPLQPPPTVPVQHTEEWMMHSVTPGGLAASIGQATM
jgi:hypothetical protein